jgi:hypothetical protein
MRTREYDSLPHREAMRPRTPRKFRRHEQRPTSKIGRAA